MAALLVAMSVMAIMMSVALPVWHTTARREREAELVFRGQQYARAIELFQRKYANALPPTLDVLVNEKFLRKKYKDPITNDDFQLIAPGTPIPGQPGTPGPQGQPGTGTTSSRQADSRTPAGAQQSLERLRQEMQRAQTRSSFGSGSTVTAGASQGIMGVASKSTDRSLRLYNGRDKYNEWVFVAVVRTQQVGGPDQQNPGGPAGVQVPGRRGGGPATAPPGFRGRGSQEGVTGPGRGLNLTPQQGRGNR